MSSTRSQSQLCTATPISSLCFRTGNYVTFPVRVQHSTEVKNFYTERPLCIYMGETAEIRSIVF